MQHISTSPPKSSCLHRVGYLLRYHRPHQVWNRVRIRCRRKWQQLTRYDAAGPALTADPAADAGFRMLYQARHGHAAPDNSPNDHFRFLGIELALGSPIDWTLDGMPNVDHLWRFHLHYQEFLWNWLSANEHDGPQRVWDCVLDWIDRYPPTATRALVDGWHPFCISKRLPTWMAIWHQHPPLDRAADILASMSQQARFLSGNLEWDLGGNHLLENLRALGLASVFFQGDETQRWLNKTEKTLTRELAKQILPHGEHYERSPMYHAHVLEVLLDLRDAAAPFAPGIRAVCQQYIPPMSNFLATISHPDGDIPLLGDATLDDAPSSVRLLNRVTRNSTESPTETSLTIVSPQSALATTLGGYWVYRDPTTHLVFDAAPLAPDQLPAHAHGDLLNFELSLGGQRIIVDSGTHGYGEGDMRQYCRGTAAHNTVVIDDADQCDMWSRFRMGYRGHPGRLNQGEREGFVWASATHDAYRRLRVPEVGRLVACRPGLIVVVDWAVDHDQRSGRHTVVSGLHLHPAVRSDRGSDGAYRVRVGNEVRLVRSLAGPSVAVATRQGWYCPRFGERNQIEVLECRAENIELPIALGWIIADEDLDVRSELSQEAASWTATVEIAGSTATWQREGIL